MPASIPIAAWIVTMLLMGLLVQPLLFDWTTLGGKYEHPFAWIRDRIAPPPAMDRTRVIAITDEHTQAEARTSSAALSRGCSMTPW